jgi:hypothetical protein
VRIELLVLAATAGCLAAGWWLTSPRFIGWLVARRLRRLREVSRALYPVFSDPPDPLANIVVINRAEPTPVPAQRSAELPPGENALSPFASKPR